MPKPYRSYNYNPRLGERASTLRRSMTKAEACLWKYVLKAGGVSGYGFHRQRPVLNYIADFFCSELMLIVEVDGSSHDGPEAQERDARRTAELKAAGFVVLRFTNEEVLTAIEGVRARLEAFVREHEATHGDRSRESWKGKRQ